MLIIIERLAKVRSRSGKTMVKYEIIRSSRKTAAIEIKKDCRVIVRAPYRMSGADIENFVEQKSPWIDKHLEIVRERQNTAAVGFTDEELRELAEEAKYDILQRVERYTEIIGVAFGKITIRRQKTRWGSCSSKGNLNFNCLLMLCPEEVRDYVVVHELCHRVELNHSERFWREVGRILPDYKILRKWLKENGNEIIGRLG